ncbi:MAG: M14 family metallopeptidase [Alphaproteobacteria bacterium]
MSASIHFAADYADARRTFLGAAARAGLEPHSLRNENGRSPGGDALYTDVVELGRRDAPSLLILNSATHGVEGFCGSGCQTGFLDRLDDFPLSENVRVLILHALNPHGFAWLRRVTEENVDLNRNFVDHAAPYPPNPDYEELAHAISPRHVGEADLRQANATLREWRQANGARALQEVITRGQYTHPEGIYFGGHTPTWSNRTLHEVMSEFARSAERVALVDFHTGLGPHGYGELICEKAENHPAYMRARRWWGESVASTVSGQSVSAQLVGTLDGGIADMLPDREVTAVALEFGTSPSNEVFRALRLDNWLHMHGDPEGPEAANIKKEIRRVFYPDTDVWKDMVWARAREVIRQALEGLAED